MIHIAKDPKQLNRQHHIIPRQEIRTNIFLNESSINKSVEILACESVEIIDMGGLLI